MERLLLIFFLITILKNTISQLFLWQIKEYRLDRFLVHLKTWQGRQLLFGKMAMLKWLLLLFAPLFIFFNASPFLFLAVSALFTLEGILSVRRFLTSTWLIPFFTPRIIFIFVAVLLLILFGLSFLPIFLPIRFLILDKVLFFLITFLIFLTNIPSKIFQKWTISCAKKKIKKYPNLLVIGITGSYGKTTTKEFLAQILSQKFKVLKTPGNVNTDIGVAKTILKSLKKDHQIFICEMGAYKKGEINSICEIVEPRIGVITGINEQHLSLFGNLKNTISAKFEIVKALPPRGFVVFNGENKYCLAMAKKAKKMGKEVKVIDREKKTYYKKNLPEDFFLLNFLMAEAVAEKLGIKSKEIWRLAKQLKLPLHTMQILKRNRLVLIDDTYNSNPQGVLAALDYLKNFKGEKIFVFQPIIELGKASARLHEEIGKKANEICDQIILTNRNFYQDFLKGAKGNVSLKMDLPKIKKGAILFEGRETSKMLKLAINFYV